MRRGTTTDGEAMRPREERRAFNPFCPVPVHVHRIRQRSRPRYQPLTPVTLHRAYQGEAGRHSGAHYIAAAEAPPMIEGGVEPWRAADP